MNIAERIDHTVLKADATKETVIRYCKEAKEYGFASVCVNTCHTALVASELKGSNVKTCCVVGFPLGAMLTSAKAFEAAEAVKAGAQEVDMVINVGAVKDKDWDFVREDIRAVVEASKPAIVKVIIETCLRKDQSLPAFRGSRRRIRKDVHRIFYRRRHRRRHPADERDCRRPSGGQSQRRHPHTGIYRSADRSRRGSDRSRKRRDPAVSSRQGLGQARTLARRLYKETGESDVFVCSLPFLFYLFSI